VIRASLLSLLLLAGCAAQPVPVHDQVFFSVKLVDELPPRVYGTAKCSFGNVCQIELLRSVYPDCLTHEIRHGFEGNWHEGYETTWDCDR
jgi:hypothetical protein